VLGIFFCCYDKRVIKIFCAMIQTCYFTAFNHRSGQTVSLFIVVLVFVDVEKRCFLFALVLVHTTATSF